MNVEFRLKFENKSTVSLGIFKVVTITHTVSPGSVRVIDLRNNFDIFYELKFRLGYVSFSPVDIFYLNLPRPL